MAYTDINSEDRLVQKTFARDLLLPEADEGNCRVSRSSIRQERRIQ